MRNTIGILKQIIDFLYEESKKDDPQNLKTKMEILEQELSKKNGEIEHLYTENSKLEIILQKYESDFELLSNMGVISSEPIPEVKPEVIKVEKEEVKPEVKRRLRPEVKTGIKPEEKQEKPEVKQEKPEVKQEQKKEEPEKRNRRDYMREYQRAYRKKQRETTANISMTV